MVMKSPLKYTSHEEADLQVIMVIDAIDDEVTNEL